MHTQGIKHSNCGTMFVFCVLGQKNFPQQDRGSRSFESREQNTCMNHFCTDGRGSEQVTLSVSMRPQQERPTHNLSAPRLLHPLVREMVYCYYTLLYKIQFRGSLHLFVQRKRNNLFRSWDCLAPRCKHFRLFDVFLVMCF